jgi:hypothetical protein
VRADKDEDEEEEAAGEERGGSDLLINALLWERLGLL